MPRDPRQPYRIGPILDAIFDRGSVFTYAEYGGATVTALARLDGHPVGVLATDPYKGTTMSVAGAQAVTRLVDLCETFHLPIVSLTDQGGLTVGPGGRGTRHDPLRRPRDRGHLPGPRAAGRADPAPGVRGRRRRHREPAPGRPELGLALR